MPKDSLEADDFNLSDNSTGAIGSGLLSFVGLSLLLLGNTFIGNTAKPCLFLVPFGYRAGSMSTGLFCLPQLLFSPLQNTAKKTLPDKR